MFKVKDKVVYIGNAEQLIDYSTNQRIIDIMEIERGRIYEIFDLSDNSVKLKGLHQYSASWIPKKAVSDASLKYESEEI